MTLKQALYNLGWRIAQLENDVANLRALHGQAIAAIEAEEAAGTRPAPPGWRGAAAWADAAAEARGHGCDVPLHLPDDLQIPG